MLLANFNGKEHLRHRAVSLRQHGFLVSDTGIPTVKSRGTDFGIMSPCWDERSMMVLAHSDQLFKLNIPNEGPDRRTNAGFSNFGLHALNTDHLLE